MRRFYSLILDSRLKGVHSLIPNYPVLGPSCFDSAQVLRCQMLPDDCLKAGLLLEKAGKKVDFVGNPIGWPIVSPRLLRLFEELARNNIQILQPNVIDSSGATVLTEYGVVNVLFCLSDVVDLDQSIKSSQTFGGKPHIITPVLRVDMIPQTCHLFRPSEAMFRLIVSEEFADAARKAKLTGMTFVEIGSVS